jgi:hypothetical protein
MKNIFLITVAAILFCSLSFGQSSDKKESEKLEISTDIGKEFDKKQLEREVTAHKEGDYKPFSSFNFPRTKYVGSAATGPIQLGDPNFNGFFFAVGNHDEFRKLFPKDSKDDYQVFFSIITYSSVESVSEQLVSSRNFPKYYIGQSSLKTKTSKIDYFAFIDSSSKSYAIVNGKIFDLAENGKTLILLPSDDGSLNFIQVKTPYLTLATLHNYYANLLKNTEIKALIGKAKSKTK